MLEQVDINKITLEFHEFFSQPNTYRSILILVVTILITYWLSRFLARGIIRVAQAVAKRSDNESDDERLVRLRQVETYLSVTVAFVRVLAVAVVAYIAWRVITPPTTEGAISRTGIAAIGAGTIFIVVAGQTLGIILRDVTAGSVMIIERWFNVGDFIKIEPFLDVSGVVEELTLRSTRIRSLSGEIIWVHNQQIQGVHVTPRGVRTLAVDIFVRDRVKGEQAIEKVINTVPTGTMMMARPLRIKYAERWSDDLWRITVVGETPPGREWLVEKYFVNALKEIDEEKKRADRLIVHEPIARYADSVADSRFKRAVRVNKDK
ncbi:MAG TPA: mechanosensitive ion channel family protein [Candidatus Saccharimonadales bacterium]|nr:mechanosensitive ion channel family protein [Candidatus Saccharimonadales bacterium]